MKKTRMIALTLVAALMLVGAGYAFWSEAMEINAAVDTGELNFEFVNEGFVGGEYVRGSATVSEDGHKLDLVFNNLHPGATATVNYCIKNTGTIGLKVEDFVFEGDNPNLEQLYVLVDGEKVPVEEYFEGLEVEDIIAVDGQRCYEMVLQVYKCADEESFNELAEFSFSIKAKVKQYNDFGECDEVEEPDDPEPEKTGLIFRKDKTGTECGSPWVKGKFYYTYDDDSEEFIEERTITLTPKYGGYNPVTVTYGGFSLTFSWQQSGFGGSIIW